MHPSYPTIYDQNDIKHTIDGLYLQQEMTVSADCLGISTDQSLRRAMAAWPVDIPPSPLGTEL